MLNFINFKNIAEKPSVLVAKYIFCNPPFHVSRLC